MSKLSFVLVPLDDSKEHEIIVEKYLVIRIKLKNGGIEHFKLIDEVHWRYPTRGKPKVAIESNKMGTGWVYEIDRIESMDIDTPDAIDINKLLEYGRELHKKILE